MGDHANDAAGADAEIGWGGGRRQIYKQPNRKAPKGSPLAKARIEAHNALDLFWQFGSMTRTEAYARLARDMGLRPDQCHILLFNEERCHQVVEICNGWGK